MSSNVIGYTLPQNYDLLNYSCFHPFNEDIYFLKGDEKLVVTVGKYYERNFNGRSGRWAANKSCISEASFIRSSATSKRQKHLKKMHCGKKCATHWEVSIYYSLAMHNDYINSTKPSFWLWCIFIGALSVAEAKKRWRYLRDCFMKAKKETYLHSKWIFYGNINLQEKFLPILWANEIFGRLRKISVSLI